MNGPNRLKVTWRGAGRKAQCPPNPAYPAGIDLDQGQGWRNCTTTIPYPAPECGQWLVECPFCGLVCVVTAAGRIDDPKSLRVVCKRQ